MANKKVYISPAQYHEDISNLVDKLSQIPFKPKKTLVIGIARGGLIPAQYVAYGLGIRDVITLQSKLYWDKKIQKEISEVSGVFALDYDYQNFILVDDIYDSGTTMNNVITLITEMAEAFDSSVNIIPAVVYTQQPKKELKELGITYSKKIKKIENEKPWVVFPTDVIGVNAPSGVNG